MWIETSLKRADARLWQPAEAARLMDEGARTWPAVEWAMTREMDLGRPETERQKVAYRLTPEQTGTGKPGPWHWITDAANTSTADNGGTYGYAVCNFDDGAPA